MDKIITHAPKLKVPLNALLRNKLRIEVQQWIAAKNILPPVAIERLQQLAGEIIQYLHLDSVYLDFVTVLCGNEIWRNVVASTPVNRRLLLLPECLKNSSRCKGTLDKLGLICNSCKSCIIDDVISKAEAMGYATLVAEGTTVAVGLVEEGAIDAVIGVSCMSVLQRSYEPVSRSAVPVIGIPLLNDGCGNTHVDNEWLFDEIENIRSNKAIQPLSVSSLKNKVFDYFKDQSIADFFPSENETESLAKQMMTVGGNRMRPLLAILAYQSYALHCNEKVQEQLAFIIECFHKASLVHDDIQDDDNYRYNEKTLHATHGIPVAINVGDFLIGKGYHILADLNVHPEMMIQSLKAVSSSHLNLSVGQGDDLLTKNQFASLTVERQLKIYELKTSNAIKVALLLGAVNGGASTNEIKCLEVFAYWFGIAYQVRDDIGEFNVGGSDKLENYPFLLAILNDQFKNSRHTFDAEKRNAQQLQQLIIDRKVIEEADRYLKYYIDESYKQLDRLQNLKMKLSLYHVMAKVFY